MAKRKQITVYLNSIDDSQGDRTCLTTYKETLADIHFLEDEDGKDFHYYIDWCDGSWDERHFDKELDAIKYVCKNLFSDKYENVRLRYGNYWNSERGAVTGFENGVINIPLN